MLILTRKPNESIIISDDIKLTVVNVEGKQVSLGIDAPQEVSVHRSEIYEKIQNEKNDSETLNKTNENKAD